jgi:hypothetical protein
VRIAAVTAALVLAAAPAGHQRFFATPTGVSCEIAVAVAGLTEVSCLVGPPQRAAKKAVSVELSPSGTLRICHGLGCVGNAPSTQTRLADGRSVVLAPFRCTAVRAGVRCVVIRLGRGFILGTAGVTRIS